MKTINLLLATQESIDRFFMNRALEHAAKCAASGEVPIGAVVVDGAAGDHVIGEAGNAPIASYDPSAHAEMTAIRRAATCVGNYRLTGATLYTTLEPCAMCAGAIVWARIARVVIALKDPKAGAAGSVLSVIPNENLNHRPVVEFGLMERESLELLQDFFSKRRKSRNSYPVCTTLVIAAKKHKKAQEL